MHSERLFKWINVLVLICIVNNIQAQDSVTTWLKNNSNGIDMTSQQAFIKTMQPALNRMARYNIIGLGEGTHGTSEFQTIRLYISRYLVEEKGYSMICLENSFGWCVELNNYLQTGKGNLDTLMRKNMLGMWQNEEMKELLQWMRDYNLKYPGRLQLVGMDYSETSTVAAIIQQLVHRLQDQALDSIASQLVMYSRMMDDAYAGFNLPKQAFGWNDVFKNGVSAYELVVALKEKVQAKLSGKKILSAADTALLRTSLLNSELAFYSLYRPVKEKEEASRDETMAKMIQQIQQNKPGAKVLVWAHNAHIARSAVFPGDNNGGGSGMYLERYFPGQYFAVATTTGDGTMSATTDRFILNTSAFKSYPLPAAIENSWENSIAAFTQGAVYLDLSDKKSTVPAKGLRFTGYGVPGKNDFIPESLPALFDGLIFIPHTQATHIRQ